MASEVLKNALLAAAREEFAQAEINCDTLQWIPSDRFNENMENLIRRTKKRQSVPVRRVLVVAAVVILTAVFGVFSSAEIREDIISFFREIYYTHSDVEYGYENAGDIVSPDGIETVYTLSAVPDGFSRIAFNKNEHSVITQWEDEKGNAIILSQGDGITKIGIDNERLEYSQAVSQGIVYEIYTEDGYVLILWNTDVYTFSIDYYGDADASEIIKIADSVKEED